MKSNNSKYGYKQQQIQIQETAHEMELVLDIFHTTLEALEEYVGKLNHYPNWDSRRQLYRKKIANSDYTLEGFEDIFLTQLFIVKASVVNKPEFFLKEVQKVFHKWINATGIDANNCPEKLKHFLFEINEVLEGRGENIVNQTRELVKNRELTTDEALEFFGKFQGPMNKNRERGSLLEGKNWNEAENRNEVGGNFEQGKEAFGQISQGFSSKHANFDLFSEQKKRRGIQNTKSGGSFFSQQGQQSTSSNANTNIIRGIQTNSRNWKIVVDVQGQTWLIHNSAQGVNSEVGILIHDRQRFTDQEWNQIKQIVDASQQRYSQNFQQKYAVSRVDLSKSNNNQFPTTPLIIGSLSLGLLLTGLIIYKVKKSKKTK